MKPPSEWPVTVAREDLVPWPGLNPRRHFELDGLDELRASIVKDGLLQPLGVKANEKPPHFIFHGERRWRAAEGVLVEIPVAFREIDETTARRLALSENIQRADLSAIEEAWGLESYLASDTTKSQRAVAEEIGKTQGWISNRLRLLRLGEGVKEILLGELITATQARDLILPFAGIAEEKWEELNAALAKQLPKVASKAGRTLVDEEIRVAVSKIVLGMSHWLESGSYDYDADKGSDFSQWILVPKEEWGSAPNGSIVKYVYSRYPSSARKTSRCFDTDWWTERMTAAVAAREKQQQEDEEGDDVVEDLEWTPDMGPIPATVTIPWEQLHVVYEPKSGKQHHYVRTALPSADVDFALNADPSDIPADKLVLRAGQKPRSPQVLCTDGAIFEAASRQLHEKRDQLIDSKKAETRARDLAAAEGVKLMDALPTLAALGYDLNGEPALEQAAKLLGFKDPPEEDGTDEWHILIARWLVEMRKLDREALLRLAVVISNRAPTENPVKKADRIIAIALRDELAAKVTFDLPVREAGTEPEPDEHGMGALDAPGEGEEVSDAADGR